MPNQYAAEATHFARCASATMREPGSKISGHGEETSAQMHDMELGRLNEHHPDRDAWWMGWIIPREGSRGINGRGRGREATLLQHLNERPKGATKERRGCVTDGGPYRKVGRKVRE